MDRSYTGVTQVESGEDATSKLDGGRRNVGANQRKLDVFHTTRSRRRLIEERAKDAEDACQMFGFKRTTSELCLSPPCSGDYAKLKKKQKGFLLSLLSQLWWFGETVQLGRLLSSSKASLCFFFMCDWNGARMKANMRRNFFIPFLFSLLWK